MNYAEIRKLDSANGPGIRVSLFVSGCEIKCPGCFNKELQDFNYGKPFTEDTIEEILEYLKHPHVRGLTILGGEPLSPSNIKTLISLVKKVKDRFPNKDIWCYTGYLLDDLYKLIKDIWYYTGYLLDDLYKLNSIETTLDAKYGTHLIVMIKYIDVLVDGPFIQELKHPGLQFRGSSNQRIIDMKQTIKQNKIIISDKYK